MGFSFVNYCKCSLIHNKLPSYLLTLFYTLWGDHGLSSCWPGSEKISPFPPATRVLACLSLLSTDQEDAKISLRPNKVLFLSMEPRSPFLWESTFKNLQLWILSFPPWNVNLLLASCQLINVFFKYQGAIFLNVSVKEESASVSQSLWESRSLTSITVN